MAQQKSLRVAELRQPASKKPKASCPLTTAQPSFFLDKPYSLQLSITRGWPASTSSNAFAVRHGTNKNGCRRRYFPR